MTPPRPLTVALGLAALVLGFVGYWQESAVLQGLALAALAGATVLIVREP